MKELIMNASTSTRSSFQPPVVTEPSDDGALVPFSRGSGTLTTTTDLRPIVQVDTSNFLYAAQVQKQGKMQVADDKRLERIIESDKKGTLFYKLIFPVFVLASGFFANFIYVCRDKETDMLDTECVFNSKTATNSLRNGVICLIGIYVLKVIGTYFKDVAREKTTIGQPFFGQSFFNLVYKG